MERRFIGFSDTMKFLSLGRMTINRLIADGDIPAYKVRGKWLFDKEELIDWVKSKRKEPKKPPAPQPAARRSRKKAGE